MKIRALKKTYEGRPVLNIPEIELEDGKIISVIGTNGSGKSTFAKILAGIIKDDEKVKPFVCEGEKDVMPKVGYLPQKPYAFNMSLEKNMNIAGKVEDDIYSQLKIDHLKNENAKKLSGGETARMALGRILAKDFDLLILDEMSASMDIESTIISEDLVKKYCERTRASIVVVTHELGQAKRISDYVMFLDKGEIVIFGPTREILDNPEDERLRDFINFYGA